jgi:hypothetical protein
MKEEWLKSDIMDRRKFAEGRRGANARVLVHPKSSKPEAKERSAGFLENNLISDALSISARQGIKRMEINVLADEPAIVSRCCNRSRSCS